MTETLAKRVAPQVSAFDEGLRALAHADEATRVRIASSPTVSESVLTRLAQDEAVTVRAAVAMNQAASPTIDRSFLGDADERVRTLLGRKLAAMMPTLPTRQRDMLQNQALVTLRSLVADEALRVRAAIADVLKDMPDAPHDLILRLAHDTEMAVAEPVIRLSPMLSTDDLLALLAAGPSPATATAVARRPRLCEEVADVIANTAGSEAIAALLANNSAFIREATLDALVSRAAEETSWHEPLLRRPILSARSARALSHIVTNTLLALLAARHDLDPALAQELSSRIEIRLDPPSTPSLRAPTMDEAMAHAESLAARGRLNEDTLLEAARLGEARMCTALLAVAAGVPGPVVDRVCTLRSAKGLVSLVWKAGFSMRVAGPLQTLLVRLPPNQVLAGLDKVGFPLAVEEMRWQIEFLTRVGR